MGLACRLSQATFLDRERNIDIRKKTDIKLNIFDLQEEL